MPVLQAPGDSGLVMIDRLRFRERRTIRQIAEVIGAARPLSAAS